MSIPQAAMTAPAPESALALKQLVVPPEHLDVTQHTSAQSPRIPHLDALAVSASSPSNHLSPANPPTESSRHSTPATSAAGSDHAQSISHTTEISSTTKLSQSLEPEHEPEQPAAERPHIDKPASRAIEQHPPCQHASKPPTQSNHANDVPQHDAFKQQPAHSSTSTPAATHHEHHPLASIQPAYFYPADGSASSSHDGIPVFEPTMHQFQDFYALCHAIDSWGMQYGIVKVVPPKEWNGSLPDLRPSNNPTNTPTTQDADQDQLADISKVRIRNAIVQHFTPAGSGVWRQTNITRTAKVWNAKQWADMCISDGQKGPEMQRMKWKVEVEGVSNGGWGPKNIGTKDSATSSILEEDGVRTRSGKARQSGPVADSKSNVKRKRADDEHDPADKSQDPHIQEPTMLSLPPASPSSPERRSHRLIHNTVKTPSTSRDASPVKQKKNWEAEATTYEEWCSFDYQNCWRREALSSQERAQFDASNASASSKDNKPFESLPNAMQTESVAPCLPSPSDWTPEICREIESEYWRSLNFGKPPMYGADLKGTLFDDRTKHWNVGKLDNVLTRLRLKRKLPGVNTPYLYWGMWRATFAWHVEDMDLYSINYIHFGAPKQWYAIRQADRQRFESAMAGAFPSDSRRCPHFMRHKSYLASPSFLASHGIRPLKLVHNAGEFVITYPYGYHSGFNLGYNCAESVNFALESWLDIGRKANFCHCDQSQNSVHIDVDAMLEESKELEELERKRELRRAKDDSVRAVEEEEMERRRIKNEKAKERRKAKKVAEEAEEAAAAANPAISLPFQGGAAFYVDPKEVSTSPCVFCPANVHADLVPTPDDIPSTNPKLKAMASRHAHRLCASFVPETWVGQHAKADVVCGIEGIDKARFSLKCQICPNASLQKLYPKIQCTRGKCPRSAHVSCALVEENGWFVDVCPGETADRLEGKRMPATTQHTDVSEDGERLVVLCKTHNPLFREAEEARKADELRERIHSLPVPSMVKIRTPSGMFQALMVEISEGEDGIVIEDEGRPSTVKFQQIIFDSPNDSDAVKDELQPISIASTEVPTAAEGSADAAHPAKRKRKASEKASAAAKAASEEVLEASIATANSTTPTLASKRVRKPRTRAEPTAPATPAAPTAVETQEVLLTGTATAPTSETAAQLKPKRQPKKMRPAAPAPVRETDTTPRDAPQAPVSWPGHPLQHLTKQPPLPAQHPQQAQSLPPAKRGMRATYATQFPVAQQHCSEQHHQYHHYQQQQYVGSEYGHMQHSYFHSPQGDAGQQGHQHVAGHPSGYAPRGYGAEGERHSTAASRYAQSSVSAASPNYAPTRTNGRLYSTPPQYPQCPAYQQHSAYPHPAPHVPPPAPESSAGGHTPQSRHSALAFSSSPVPPMASSATSTPTSSQQYGYLSAPPATYRDRTPPLPTYGKPISHQPQHLPNGDTHAFPDYRPPYHHAAPASLHPSYQASAHQQQQQQQQYRGSQQQPHGHVIVTDQRQTYHPHPQQPHKHQLQHQMMGYGGVGGSSGFLPGQHQHYAPLQEQHYQRPQQGYANGH